MFETLKHALRVKNTYRTNSFVYTLRIIPLVGKLIPYSFYSEQSIKILGYIVTAVAELISTFGYKLLYIFAALFIPFQIYSDAGPQAFLHIFFFLTLGGAFFNHTLLEGSKDKFYAISLLRMDARKYTLSVFGYYLFKLLLGMTAPMVIFCLVLGLNPLLGLLCGPLVVGVKILYAAFQVHAKRNFPPNRTDYSGMVFGLAAVALAYGLPALGIVLPPALFAAISICILLLAVPCARYLLRFSGYRRLYKSSLSGIELLLDPKKGATAMVSKQMQSKLDLTAGAASDKQGYAYFHQLFMARHRRLMSRSANRIALVCLVLMAALILLPLFIKEAAPVFNSIPLSFLPYFTFIMYAVNRGQTITQAMFMNCDHSMLAYRFYRRPSDILGLFTKRLLSVVKINLPPALVIGLGLAAVLYTSGGTAQPLNYVVLAVAIPALSVFFSVHHLVMYYLLQPYNAEVEMKSKMYNIVSFVTYMVSYVFIQVKLPTLLFGSAVIAFTLLYLAIALILSYRYAPKTFKLR